MPEFKWNPPIFAADSRAQVIVRGNERIKTSDGRFDEFVCTYRTEIKKAQEAAFELINKCESWKQGASIVPEMMALHAIDEEIEEAEAEIQFHNDLQTYEDEINVEQN